MLWLLFVLTPKSLAEAVREWLWGGVLNGIMELREEMIMYECPNCGGNLKFHIPSQQLFCAHCESRFDPYSIHKETDTVDGDCFETNVFLCPQCGGEMISGDNDATSFCSYCGSANILSGRISREKRPRFIIPFKKTKEDCKKAYAQKMRKAFFVPNELKNPDFIEGFRGIYMPYWSYRIVQKGDVSLTGKVSKRKGDYVYTDHYALEGELDAGYEGYSYDASSTFYDNISEALAPYDVRDRKEFTPTFLSGFYADTADVDSEIYREDAEKLANNVTYGKMAQEPVFKKHGIEPAASAGRLSDKLKTSCDSVDSAMFPVWFMSYRNGNRIAYAAVNGQTGKVVADMPVDEKKFFAGSLLLAIPVFILLNLLLTLRPSVLLGASAVLAVVAALVYYRELAAIFSRESNEEDRALQMKGNGKNKQKEPKKRRGSVSLVMIIIIIWMFFGGITVGVDAVFASLTAGAGAGAGAFILWLMVFIAMGWICVLGIRKYNIMKTGRLEHVKGGRGFLLSWGAVLLGGVIRLWSPVSDLWYYGAALLILLTVVFILKDLIGNYNRLAMRRLPQFDKKGGDDNA